MKLGRRVFVSGYLLALAIGVPGLMSACGEDSSTSSGSIKSDEKAQAEHNNKMQEYMKSKKTAPKK